MARSDLSLFFSSDASWTFFSSSIFGMAGPSSSGLTSSSGMRGLSGVTGWGEDTCWVIASMGTFDDGNGEERVTLSWSGSGDESDPILVASDSAAESSLMSIGSSFNSVICFLELRVDSKDGPVIAPTGTSCIHSEGRKLVSQT